MEPWYQSLVLSSLLASGILLTRTAANMGFFVNYYGDKENMYFVFRKGDVVKCPVIERNVVLDLVEKYRRELRTYISSASQLYGYVTPKPIHDRFKMIIRNEKGDVGASTGSVCYSNSELKKSVMENLIHKIDGTFWFTCI